MKVYAEHFPEKNVRRKTLLQFGDSTELIGSAVLANPGSAAPIDKKFDKSVITQFYQKVHKAVMDTKDWYPFSDDPTMRWLEKIFNGWYVNKNNKTIELNGVVQLFNCFYIMNPDREIAIKQFVNKPEFVFNESKYFLDKPVYFGWGNLGTNKALSEIARNIFTGYNSEYTPIYNTGFENNKFYHPQYININYGRNDEIKRILKGFHRLIK